MAVLILGGLLALAYLAGAVLGGVLIDWEDDGGDADRLFWMLFLIGGAVLLAAGLFVGNRSPSWLAAALISVGAIAGAIPTFWTIVIPIAAIALVVLSVLWMRRPAATVG